MLLLSTAVGGPTRWFQLPAFGTCYRLRNSEIILPSRRSFCFCYSALHIKLQLTFARRACLLLFATPSASACCPVRDRTLLIHCRHPELFAQVCPRMLRIDVYQGIPIQSKTNEHEVRSTTCSRRVHVLREDRSCPPSPLAGGDTNMSKQPARAERLQFDMQSTVINPEVFVRHQTLTSPEYIPLITDLYATVLGSVNGEPVLQLLM